MPEPEPAVEQHDGTLVAQLRRAARLSQERLAELTGLSIRSIRGIERGAVRRPHLNTLHSIADALSLSTHQRTALAEAFGHPAETPSRPSLSPAELPRDLADFVGRAEELESIDAVLGAGRPAYSTAPVAVISGQGGTGKTSLALHAAHLQKTQYPDGQLYASLAGPTGVGATPNDALVDVLTSIGLDAGRMPPDHDGRVRAFRSLTSGARYLLLIDNATDARGLEDLLPAGPGNAVLVTSRPELPEISPTLTIRLGMCTADEAIALLRSSAADHGRQTESDDDTEWAALAHECTYLPLALRVAGSRLAARSDWGPRELLTRMASGADRLHELRHGALSVDEAIATSFEALPSAVGHTGINPAEAMLRLGLLPTTDFSTALAADVLGCTPAEADDVIGALRTHQLLGLGSNGRHRFHDLVRDFAEVRAVGHDKRIDPAATYDALGRYLSRNLRLAGDVGLVRHVTVDTEVRPFVEDEAQHAVYERWLPQEFPTMRDYVVAAADTPGADLDLAMEVARPLRELCDMRTDLDTALLVSTHLADASRAAGRWLYFAWAQGRLATQASMRRGPQADELLATADEALAETDPEQRDLIQLQLALVRGVTAGFLGRLSSSEAHFREGLRLLGSSRRPIRILLILNLAETMIRLNRPREAMRYLTRDPDLMAEMGQSIQLRSEVKLAKCLNLLGSHADALASSAATFRVASDAQLPAVAVEASVELARAHEGLGRSGQARWWARDSIRRADELHRPDLAERSHDILQRIGADPPGSVVGRRTSPQPQSRPSGAALPLDPEPLDTLRELKPAAEAGGGAHAGPPATAQAPPDHRLSGADPRTGRRRLSGSEQFE